MTIEGDDKSEGVRWSRIRKGLADDLLVSNMDAIEETDR